MLVEEAGLCFDKCYQTGVSWSVVGFLNNYQCFKSDKGATENRGPEWCGGT